MEVRRQKNQVQTKLTIFEECKGEALNSPKWVETSRVANKTEHPAGKNIEMKFLGFSFTAGIEHKKRIAPGSIKRFK